MKKLIRYTEYEVKRAIDNLRYKLIDYLNNNSEYIIITILEGGIYVSYELLRSLPENYLDKIKTYSMKISSYQGTERGVPDFEYIPNIDLNNKNVIVIDDFCDSGSTLNAIYKFLVHKKVKTVKFFTLLARQGFQLDERVDVEFGIIDDAKNNFYIGCGLDDNGKYRMINYIYYLKDEKEET